MSKEEEEKKRVEKFNEALQKIMNRREQEKKSTNNYMLPDAFYKSYSSALPRTLKEARANRAKCPNQRSASGGVVKSKDERSCGGDNK